MNKKLLIGAMVALIAVVGAWYAFSPQWTLWQMREAAEARNVDKLSNYIDYPKVRESMKSQLKAAMAAKMMEGGSNGFEALGMAMGMQMMDPMIDAMISPEGMQAGLANASKKEPREGPKKAPFELGADKDSEIMRDGFNIFRVVLKKPKEEPSHLIFERRGLGWVMVGIQMPTEKL